MSRSLSYSRACLLLGRHDKLWPERITPGSSMSRRSKLWRAIVGAGAGLGAMVAVHAAAVDKYLDDAKRYQEKGEHRAAIIQFKNALQQDANNRDARMLLAQSYLQIGDGASAEKELKRAQELGASPDQVVPLLAKSYLLQAKLRQLLAHFQPDKQTSPQARATIIAPHRTAHQPLKEFAQAQDNFDAAHKLDGGSSDALLGRLRAAIYQQHIAEAQQQADELVKRFPRLAEAWLLKGEIHRMRSEPQLALDAYQQVISIEPDNINGYIGHAMMLISQQKHAEAGRDLDVLSQKVPQHPMVHYLKGLAPFHTTRINWKVPTSLCSVLSVRSPSTCRRASCSRRPCSSSNNPRAPSRPWMSRRSRRRMTHSCSRYWAALTCRREIRARG